jgi:catechol 2,3-dioxygenase-like lactoylglutathione lyase family enzyme
MPFCSLANRCNALGKFTFSDYCIEFFPLLKRSEKCACFAVSCYRRRQTVDIPFRCLNFTGCSADPRFMGWSEIPRRNRDGPMARCYGQMLKQEGWVRPRTNGILESSLYVSDVPRSVRFYEETFGFRVISEFGERGCAMQAGARQVLLLFKKGASRATQSPHDGDGELHVAFAIPSDELANWESWLQTRGITVEEKRTWDLGGWSLYFRDPDRHLVEVATPGTWPVY